MSEPTSIIRDSINNGPMTFAQVIIVTIAFILNCIDGVDVVAVSVAAPVLSEAWQISPVQTGYILSAALIGMCLGAIFLAPLGDIYGRRKIVLLSALLTGLSMIASGFVEHSVELMIIIRAVSGLGVGAILASGAAFGSEFTPERYKNLTVSIIISGFPFGAAIVGPIAAYILPNFGWQTLFISAGITTLLICLIAFFLLPESVQYLEKCKGAERGRIDKINKVLRRIGRAPIDHLSLKEDEQEIKAADVKALLAPNILTTTLKLWTIFFMGYLVIYFFLAWVPSLFVANGWSMSQGIYALTISNLGAVLGTVCLGLLTTKYKLTKPIGIFFATAGLLMFCFTLSNTTDLVILYVLIFLIGVFLNGAFCGMFAVAARTYQTKIKSTGIGWCAGIGRTGAILAPILVGYLVATNFDIYALFSIFAVPIILAATLVITVKV